MQPSLPATDFPSPADHVLPLRLAPRVWDVGALCRAVADSLQARFNPVSVRGEIAGFSLAGSGHCYFSLKDSAGQLRCAMFRRSALGLDFTPRDGDLVEVTGKLGVYEQRGDLQLIVERLQRAGQGALFEQFLRLKARLQAEGLFAPERKRPLPRLPRGLGLVTSLGAAALHDVASALQRRAPHVPVVLAPALVQGAGAPASIVQALHQLYALAQPADAGPGSGAGHAGAASAMPPIDAILLVRGGGALEDLWTFNDEAVARAIVQSPVPVISGVGHETDFTIADFCADLRAPTPTAAAELAVAPREQTVAALQTLAERHRQALRHTLDRQAQRLDLAALHLVRPGQLLVQHRMNAQHLAHHLHATCQHRMQHLTHQQHALHDSLRTAAERHLQQQRQRLDNAALRLELLNPQHLMARGWTMLTTVQGQVLTRTAQAPVGTPIRATLTDGTLDLTVTQPRLL